MPTSEKKPRMVNITLNIPDSYDEAIMALQSFNLTPSRSEFIRSAIRDYVMEELKYSQDLDNFYNIIANHPILTGGI